MSRIDTRRQRRTRGSHADTNGADAVTLKSPEFIEKLIREFHDNTNQADIAQDEANRAFADAAKRERQGADLGAKEQAALAKVRQLQAELQQIQDERQEAARFAEQARNYGTAQMEKRDSHVSQATDARAVMEQFQIPVPEDREQRDPPALPASSDGGTAGVTRVDPGEDARIDTGVTNLVRHHEEDPAGESGVA